MSNSIQDLISIIIPVYNVEKYLDRCLNSIIAQSYKNWEAILINDGSTDKSGEICNYYSMHDSRFKVIHQENSGVSKTRNVGIKVAKGNYITFCDPDDYYSPENLEKLVNCFENNEVDIAICNYNFIDQYNLIKNNNTNLQEKVFEHKEAFEYLIYGKFKDYLWNKMFKAHLFKNIEFINVVRHEDSIIMPTLFHLARKVSTIKYVGYVYFRYRQGNISSSKSVINELALCKAANVKFELASMYYNNLLNIISYQAINAFINLNMRWKRSDIKTEFEKNIWKEILSCIKNIYLSNKINLPFKYKIRAFLSIKLPIFLNIIGIVLYKRRK